MRLLSKRQARAWFRRSGLASGWSSADLSLAGLEQGDTSTGLIYPLHRHPLGLIEMVSEPLQWKRTGKITLRCEPYLIMRFSTGYTALYGPQCERVTIGIYPTAAEAQNACAEHRQKETEAP
jgi:hypothetical protein